MAVPTIRVTWALPPELYESLKAEAGRKGVSMQALAIEKLQAHGTSRLRPRTEGLEAK